MSDAGSVNATTGVSAGLTPRQQEILSLLSAGVSNKEIAAKLGISLGTVKQHLAELYKRMNVRNRAMAVSKVLSRSAAGTAQASVMRRPCAAMSVELSADCPDAVARYVQRALAGFAFDGKAIYLAKARHGGDLVFGIKHHAGDLLATVLQISMMLLDELQQLHPDEVAQLRISVTLGMALVKTKRFGQALTDDLVASTVVAEARKLVQATDYGCIGFSPAAQQVLRAEGLGATVADFASTPLADIPQLFRQAPDREPYIVERPIDWQSAEAQLGADDGRLLVVVGETGMGKTSLLRALVEHHPAGDAAGLTWLQVLPLAPALLIDVHTLQLQDLDGLREQMHGAGQDANHLWVLDDFHLLNAESQQQALDCRADGFRGKLLLSGRRLKETGADFSVHLQRMDDAAITAMVGHLLPDGKQEQVDALAAEAAGIPLFAWELARGRDGEVPLALLMMIAERLEGLRLDWHLLAALAQGNKAMPVTELAEIMRESESDLQQSVVAAARAGVLEIKGSRADAWVSFRHPLLRRVVTILCVDVRQAADRQGGNPS